jgi:hypothetical protein
MVAYFIAAHPSKRCPQFFQDVTLLLDNLQLAFHPPQFGFKLFYLIQFQDVRFAIEPKPRLPLP